MARKEGIDIKKICIRLTAMVAILTMAFAATAHAAADQYVFWASAQGMFDYAYAKANYTADRAANAYAHVKVEDANGRSLGLKSSDGPRSTTKLTAKVMYGEEPSSYRVRASGYTYMSGSYTDLLDTCLI